MQLQIVIIGDTDTDQVTVTGHIEDMHVVHWLFGEAHREIMRLRNEKVKAGANGSGLVVVPSLRVKG